MSKKNEITVVVSSRKQGDEMEDYLKMLRETCGCPAKIIFVTNDNSMGLCELYGGLLANTNIDSEIMVFCHDDIDFLRPGWGQELISLFKHNKKYGIIGVAGSAQFDTSHGMWWNYKKIYGQVLHRHEGKSWLTAFSPLLKNDLEEVCVIDGLFMAFHRGRVRKNFDPELEGFDWYDIDVCLANYLDGGCKIGVTTNIRIAHNSIGELSEQWHKNKEIVFKKYKDMLPIDIAKPNDDKLRN